MPYFITYDRRGSRRSDVPSGGYDFDTLADDVAALIDHLGLRDVTLIGHSMGTGEVARYRRPSKRRSPPVVTALVESGQPGLITAVDGYCRMPLCKVRYCHDWGVGRESGVFQFLAGTRGVVPEVHHSERFSRARDLVVRVLEETAISVVEDHNNPGEFGVAIQQASAA